MRMLQVKPESPKSYLKASLNMRDDTLRGKSLHWMIRCIMSAVRQNPFP